VANKKEVAHKNAEFIIYNQRGDEAGAVLLKSSV